MVSVCGVPAAVSEEEKEEMLLDLVDRDSAFDPRRSNGNMPSYLLLLLLLLSGLRCLGVEYLVT